MKKTGNRLVVGDASWAADIPEWLLDAVRGERIVSGFIDLLQPEKVIEEVGDAEVCVYLFTASLRAPLPHDLAEVYFWVSSRLMERLKKPLVDFMAAKLKAGLSPDEARELAELRHCLWTQREARFPILFLMLSANLAVIPSGETRRNNLAFLNREPTIARRKVNSHDDPDY